MLKRSAQTSLSDNIKRNIPTNIDSINGSPLKPKAFNFEDLVEEDEDQVSGARIKNLKVLEETRNNNNTILSVLI